MSSGIFDEVAYENPKYQHLEKYVHIMYRGMWTPAKYEKLIREVDTPHYFNSMSEIDKSLVARCILSVLTVEDKVKNFWNTLWLDIPQTIVSDVGALFAQSETTHRRSYHSLGKNLKLNIEDYIEHPAIKGRLKYLNKHLDKDPKIIGKKRILKKLVLFTALVERCSLFTSFYILMSYAKHSKGLKTISALQQSTSVEECVHYDFGIDLINIIKEEYPQLWEEYLIDLVTKNINDAYKAELNIIDWFFEKGTPSHITKEEVINFLNYNFNKVCVDLGIDKRYEFNQEMFDEKSTWFIVKTTVTEPDFFDNAVGGYSSEDEEVDLENFDFN